MKNFIATFVAAVVLVLNASAKLPGIKELEANESIQVEEVFYANVTGSRDYLFTKDKVVIKENGKLLGELALTAEEKGQVDEYLELISKKHDDHSKAGTAYKITKRQGDKVLFTLSCTVGSNLRETKKKILSLYELAARLAKPK